MTAPLDMNALRNLRAVIGGDTEDLMELVADFVAELPQQMKKMVQFADSGDRVALRIAAHSCKSNARDLGAAQLSVLCAELEKACAKEEAPLTAPLIAQITVAGDAALTAYASLDPADV